MYYSLHGPGAGKSGVEHLAERLSCRFGSFGSDGEESRRAMARPTRRLESRAQQRLFHHHLTAFLRLCPITAIAALLGGTAMEMDSRGEELLPRPQHPGHVPLVRQRQDSNL